MYVSFKGKTADLYNNSKQIIRRFRAATEIVNAQVQTSGKDTFVAITMKDGKTLLYKSNGQLVRR